MMASPPSTSDVDNVIVLIHGVGVPAEDLFGTSLAENLQALDIGTHRIMQIDWHRAVMHPFSSTYSINFGHLRKLMRGFAGAAARARSPNMLQILLSVLIPFLPVFIFVYSVALPSSIAYGACEFYFLITLFLLVGLGGAALLRLRA